MPQEQTLRPDAPAIPPMGEKIRYGSPRYNEIAEFYIEEALLLDDNRLLEWIETLTVDLLYTAPMRVTRMNEDPVSDIVRTVQHFDDNYTTIRLRARRLSESRNVWAENPRARTRRFVSNVSAHYTAKLDEFAVVSYVLLMRNKAESPNYTFVTARRNDVLRLVDGKLKLAQRESIIDMSVLGVPHLVTFL